MRTKCEREISHLIENGLSSSGKIKILRLFLINPDRLFTRYKLGKKVPLRPVDIRSDVKILVELG